MPILQSDRDGGVDDGYDYVLSSLHTLCLQGGKSRRFDIVEMGNKGDPTHESYRINRSADEIDGPDGGLYREKRMGIGNCGNCDVDLEGISETTLKAMWEQHFTDKQQNISGNIDCSRKRHNDRYESIASLEGQGVGSFDHLNMLSSEQLHDMHRMVEDHDDRHREKGSRHDLIPFEWLDYLCS